MKLIEDNGEVIANLKDSTAIIILEAGEQPWALASRTKGHRSVTQQTQLATAIVDYLTIPGNVDHIIASTLPRKRAPHRHN